MKVHNGGMSDKIRKILSLDGKTQRDNTRAGQKANHIVSAVDDSGFCVGEELVDEKSNEITAIPELRALFGFTYEALTIQCGVC
jgi:hypothetical protein